MNKLQQQIINASQKYYESGTSDLTDEQFDNLLNELKEENPNDPLLTAVGHGYDVELDSTFGDKVKHLYGPAKSLPKCHNFREYKSEMNSDSVYASLKLDGMSVVLYYDCGQLTLALTRGSGEGDIGIDITNKIKYICKESLSLKDTQFTGAVRGELLMSYDNFEIFQSVYDGEASNPRNSAVGLVKSKEFDESAVSLVDLVVYSVVGIDRDKMIHKASTFESYSGAINWLTDNFPNVVYYRYTTCNEIMFDHTMNQLRKEWYGKYPADGIVISADAGHLNQFDGSKYTIIREAVAYKFPAETKETVVKKIEWKLGRSKNLIPRVNFETVQLAGTEVSWAHGDNAQNILNSKLGEGAVVVVKKAGEIIPHIEQVITPSDNVSVPDVCPACSSKLVWNGMHLHCPNTDCSDFGVQDLLVWCKYVAPFDGLGDILKLKFFSEYFGGMHNVSIKSIYEHEAPVAIEGGSVQYNNFCKMYELLLNRTVNLSESLKALNVPRIGEVTADKLARFPNLVKRLMYEEISEIDPDLRKQIGNANCNSILINNWKFKRLRYIENNINWEIQPDVEVKGKVVITGKLSIKRDAFEAELKSKGYVTSGTVTKDTFCLITDSPDSGTTKNKQADALGVMKLTESEFRLKYLS